MNFISNRLSRFHPSLTVKITQKAREMTRDGIKVISLSSGEPDFDTPDHIKGFAIEAMAREVALDGGAHALLIVD